MLLLYIDDLFLIGEEELIERCKKETCYGVRDERPRDDALLLRHGGVA